MHLWPGNSKCSLPERKVELRPRLLLPPKLQHSHQKKIISIFDISIEVVLDTNEVKVGDILQVTGDEKYRFEVVEISNTSATCISLESTRGLTKGASVEKLFQEK